MSKIKLIDEVQFETEMKTIVEPFLAEKRQSGYFITFDNKNIHYEAYTRNDAKANVIIMHGFTENVEKFWEMAYYFLQANCNVFMYDQRGHGFSDRIYGKAGTVKIDSFDDYVKDLDVFIQKIVLPMADGLSLYAYSHSLGSTVALLYAQKNPYIFNKIVLSSPMICPNTGMPTALAEVMAKAICACAGKGLSVPGRCKFDPNETYEISDETSKARFDYYHAKRLANVKYQTQGPSFGWVKAALEASKKLLHNENCRKLEMPILMFQPQQDRQVLEEAQNEFARKVKNIKNIYMRSCKHEIFASSNDVLEMYLDDIFSFFNL